MKGLRTMLFNAAVAAATAGIAMIDPAVLQEVLGSKYGWLVLPTYAGVNMILRAVTNSPVGRVE